MFKNRSMMNVQNTYVFHLLSAIFAPTYNILYLL